MAIVCPSLDSDGGYDTVVAVILAALSSTLDFAQIERAVAAGAPKYLEWLSSLKVEDCRQVS